MKKIFSTALILCAMAMAGKVNAQACGNSGPSACTPADTISTPGFENPDSVPCIVQGVAYNNSIQFLLFNTFNFLGPESVDSIQFTGISNLPCGVCWATNAANNLFYPNHYGCISLQGTTEDTVGQYLLSVKLTAWVNGSGGLPIPASEVNQAGIYMYVRTESASLMDCAAVDTATTNNTKNLTAHTGCVTSIDEISTDLTRLNITPNPVYNNAILSFNSSKNASYKLQIADITGRVLSAKELQVNPGENSNIIERNGLPAGMYFLTLTEGKSVVSLKFVVAD